MAHALLIRWRDNRVVAHAIVELVGAATSIQLEEHTYDVHPQLRHMPVVRLPCEDINDYLGNVGVNKEPSQFEDNTLLVGYYTGDDSQQKAQGWLRSITDLASLCA